MKRVLSFGLVMVLTIVAGAAAASAQSASSSLGDSARAVKRPKPAAGTVKTYDNDNLPRGASLSVVGKPAEPSAEAGKDKDEEPQPAAGKADAAKSSGDSGKANASAGGGDQKKELDTWKQKLEAQKQKIDLLSRELNVVQREYQIRAAAFYADAGNRLRNSADWDTQDSKYKQQIADKQKAVDTAKSELSDLEEQARKAGAPASPPE